MASCGPAPSTDDGAHRGQRPLERGLRFVVFDLPALGGIDLRDEPWAIRRDRLELLARAFVPPVELSPLVEPWASLAERVLSGDLEGIVLKDRQAPYRSGSRRGWAKVKAPDWHERHRRRFGGEGRGPRRDREVTSRAGGRIDGHRSSDPSYPVAQSSHRRSS